MFNQSQIRKVPRLFLAIVSLLRKRTWGPYLEAWETTGFDHAFSISWSQGGEDLALLQLLPSTPGTYIDVGAHHPSRFSVTRHLYQRGWRGLNIDANPDAIASFLRDRPDEISLNACVGNLDRYSFHIFTEPAISTNNDEWRKRFLSESQAIKRTIEMQGVTLYSIITQYFTARPDLLLVDAEGSDFDVLKSCRWDELPEFLWPGWIICETSPPASTVQNFTHVKFLLDLGYEIYCILPMSTILKLNESYLNT